MRHLGLINILPMFSKLNCMYDMITRLSLLFFSVICVYIFKIQIYKSTMLNIVIIFCNLIFLNDFSPVWQEIQNCYFKKTLFMRIRSVYNVTNSFYSSNVNSLLDVLIVENGFHIQTCFSIFNTKNCLYFFLLIKLYVIL